MRKRTVNAISNPQLCCEDLQRTLAHTWLEWHMDVDQFQKIMHAFARSHQVDTVAMQPECSFSLLPASLSCINAAY